MSDLHDTEPDVTVPVPLGLLRARGNPELSLYAELVIRSRDGLIACSARDAADWMEWTSYGTAWKYLRRLVAAGALELLYAGTFAPGDVSKDANLYRLPAVDNPTTARPGARRRRAGKRAETARQEARTSTPYGGRGDAAQTASGDPHRYPCYCDACMDNLVALTARDDP